MSEKQIKLNVSWIVPWFAGLLFTVGFIDLSILKIEHTTDVLGAFIALFFGWPLILGLHLGGNF